MVSALQLRWRWLSIWLAHWDPVIHQTTRSVLTWKWCSPLGFIRSPVGWLPSSRANQFTYCSSIALRKCFSSHLVNRVVQVDTHASIGFFSSEIFSSVLTLESMVLIESTSACRPLDNCVTIDKPEDRNTISHTFRYLRKSPLWWCWLVSKFNFPRRTKKKSIARRILRDDNHISLIIISGMSQLPPFI